MHWSDTAIILSVRKHGETSAVMRVLARGHGVYAGVVRGANSKNNRGILQPGNVVNVTWQARLSEHIGSFKVELQQAHAAHIMQDAMKLAALSSACAMVELSLPERHPYPKLYQLFYTFLADLRASDDWLQDYIRLELDLLAEAGFGLDLSECAATGTRDDLIYVSPKSGRAVSREAGEPYKDKLLKLPSFLLPPPLRGRAGVGGEAHAAFANHRYEEANLEKAKALRKNPTDVEKKLWHLLRDKQLEQYKFRRQQPIGNYIVDFFCKSLGLVIELDGGQHAIQKEYDDARTEFLKGEGYRVLRFWNNEITENMDGVYERILSEISHIQASLTPHPTLPLKGGGLSEIAEGLALTGYFLEHWLLTPHNRKLPATRGRLLQALK